MDIFSGITGNLIDLLCSLIKNRIKSKELLEAYRIEVKNNRALLQVVDFDKIKSVHINDMSLRSIVQALQIQVGASIFLDPSKKRQKAFEKALSVKKHIVFASETEDESIDLSNTVRQALSFTVRKITELKTLSIAAENGGNLFKSFKLDVRFKNINEAFKSIDEVLDSLKTL